MKAEEVFAGSEETSPGSLESGGGPPSLFDLYLTDETAWLDRTAQLVSERRYTELDCDHLSEFLTDMARRDRREVLSRLSTLLMHLLKWEYQPDRRSSSWRRRIEEQRLELQDLFRSGTLQKHGEVSLKEAYGRAVKLASIETGIEERAFPRPCPFSLQDALEKPYESD